MSDFAPAAWHPDPSGRHELRYWDGARWTDNVSTRGLQSIEPIHTATPAPASVHAPPGWYPDPYGQHELRYWDGGRWTDHVHSHGRPGGGHPAVGSIAPVGGTLFTEQVLVVNQRARLVNSRVEYAIRGADGRQLGRIQELGSDLMDRAEDWGRGVVGLRQLRRERRFSVIDMSDRVLLNMTRPHAKFFQTTGRLVVDGPQGTQIGQISHQPWSAADFLKLGITGAAVTAALATGPVGMAASLVAYGAADAALGSKVKGYDKALRSEFILESGDQRLGSILADTSDDWDFAVLDPQGVEIARITKTWAGWIKERFTKADNYVVQMHRPLDEPLRSLVIAAALSIDVELKQNGDQTSGSSLWGTRRYK